MSGETCNLSVELQSLGAGLVSGVLLTLQAFSIMGAGSMRPRRPAPANCRAASRMTVSGTELRSARTPGSAHPYFFIRSSSQLAAGNRSYPARSVIVRYTSRRPSRVPSTDNARHTSSYDDRSTGLLASVSVTSGAV